VATAHHVDTALGRQWLAPTVSTGQYPDRYNAQGAASYISRHLPRGGESERDHVVDP